HHPDRQLLPPEGRRPVLRLPARLPLGCLTGHQRHAQAAAFRFVLWRTRVDPGHHLSAPPAQPSLTPTLAPSRKVPHMKTLKAPKLRSVLTALALVVAPGAAVVGTAGEASAATKISHATATSMFSQVGIT